MNKRILVTILFMAAFLLAIGAVLATPNGATSVTPVSSSFAGADQPQSNTAYAGNITELTVFGYSTTQSWQGYAGNVSGAIRLADSSGKVMYNWSQISARGEIYASRNNTISWSYVECLNFTANGTYCSEDNNQAGATSLCGMNLSTIENTFNISLSDADGVNETFNLNNHAAFFTGTLNFSAGECKNTKVFGPDGAATFDEALLYEPTGRSVIFTSILSDNTNGYDSKTHDFEMLVLEDGHNGDTTGTPYYFYVELG